MIKCKCVCTLRRPFLALFFSCAVGLQCDLNMFG